MIRANKYAHLVFQSAPKQSFVSVFVLLFSLVTYPEVPVQSFVPGSPFASSLCKRRCCSFKIQWLVELFLLAHRFLHGTVYTPCK